MELTDKELLHYIKLSYPELIKELKQKYRASYVTFTLAENPNALGHIQNRIIEILTWELHDDIKDLKADGEDLADDLEEIINNWDLVDLDNFMRGVLELTKESLAQ